MNNPVILSVGAERAVTKIKNSAERFEKSVEKLIKLEILKAKGITDVEELEKLLKE